MTRTAKRPERTPIHERSVISFKDQDPDYVYRLVNDDGEGRLDRFIDAGYEFVESDLGIGDTKVADASTLSSRVTKAVGGGRLGYLMRIPRKFYDEDQKAKARELDRNDEALRSQIASKAEGQYGGKFEITQR